ncbi:MAG: dihydropteroate synthase [Nitrospinae bacterium]|jgi:dihydropteroate synthase|nr:dihydropteroate synthase [Nitrospinota bacterium]MDA1108463.1 dihydropteroate synthase [Nitrospinota bacterium]
MSFSFQKGGTNGSVALMGIVNLSPDSFYEGSRSFSDREALLLAERHIEEGASVIDIGAESSRPGSQPISEAVELERLLPVVSEICKRFDVAVSVDTYKPRVIDAVLSEGASIINDITGLQGDERAAGIIARHRAGVILMHMRGTPLTMQDQPQYSDLIEDVRSYLKKSIELAESAGIDKIVIDPGIGFGKTRSHNLELIRRLEEFKELGKPILLGVSRKSFIGETLDLPAKERLEGSLAAAAIGVLNGATIIRTHDVKATGRAVKVALAIMNE